MLRVKVVDEGSGHPIAGVRLVATTTSLTQPVGELSTIATTDSDGDCAMSLCVPFALVKPGFQARCIDPVQAGIKVGGNIVVRLRPARRLRVSCRSHGGDAAVGVKVVVTRVGSGAASLGDDATQYMALDAIRAPHIRVTDEHGVSEFSELADLDYYVAAYLPGYCSVLEDGQVDYVRVVPGVSDISILLAPILVARARLASGLTKRLSMVTGHGEGRDVTGVISRRALQLIPEMGQELWVAKLDLGGASEPERVLVYTDQGDIIDAELPYQALLTSAPVVLGPSASRQEVSAVTLEARDSDGRLIPIPLRLSLIRGEATRASPFSSIASGVVTAGTTVSLIAGRYELSANDIAREWFPKRVFDVGRANGYVSLNSQYSLDDVTFRLVPPFGSSPTRWTLIVQMRGLPKLLRQCGEDLSCTLWLPSGSGSATVRSFPLADAVTTFSVDPSKGGRVVEVCPKWD